MSTELSALLLGSLLFNNVLHVFTARGTLHVGEAANICIFIAIITTILSATICTPIDTLKYASVTLGVYIVRWVGTSFLGILPLPEGAFYPENRKTH